MGLQSGVPLVTLQSPFHTSVGLSRALQEGGVPPPPLQGAPTVLCGAYRILPLRGAVVCSA